MKQRGGIGSMLGVVALVALTGTATPLPAQTGAASTPPFLLELAGERVSVRYTPGSLSRATQLQLRLDALVADLSSWTKQGLGLAVHLFSREDWERTGLTMTYGLPQTVMGGGLALPAWGDVGTVELWRGLLGGELPLSGETVMRGTPEESASLGPCDLLGEVAATRSLLSRAGIRADSAWATELLTHMLTLGSKTQRKDQDLHLAADIYTRWSEGGSRPGKRPLEGWKRDLPPEEWLWYQAQFYLGARQALGGEGAKQVKSLMKQTRKQGGRLTQVDLLERFPGLSIWLDESFAPAAGEEAG